MNDGPYDTVLERTNSVRRPKTCRAIIARLACAEVRTTAATIATTRYVVETARVAIGVGAVGDAFGVSGEGVDAGDNRRGNACATEDEPTLVSLIGIAIVDRDTCVGVRYRRDIGNGSTTAFAILLPGWFADIGRAATTGTTPHRLATHTIAIIE